MLQWCKNKLKKKNKKKRTKILKLFKVSNKSFSNKREIDWIPNRLSIRDNFTI